MFQPWTHKPFPPYLDREDGSRAVDAKKVTGVLLPGEAQARPWPCG